MSDTPEVPAIAPVKEDAQQGSTQPENNQQEQNISKLEDTNISTLGNADIQKPNDAVAGLDAEKWRGDKRYYQSGDKAGQLRPSATKDEKQAVEPQLFKGGLKVDALKKSVEDKTATPSPMAEKTAKEKKAEKRAVEAKVGAKMAMRMLDVLTGWISAGTYGKDFTPEQTKDRNEYRENLEKDWEDYLLTLDIPMHPGLVVAFGSMLYVAPAFQTEKGQEKTKSLKQKIGGWMGGLLVRKMTGG